MRISLEPGERTFIVGSTGSGKTYLARRLLWNAKNLVVVDVKHGFTWSDTKNANTGDSPYDLVFTTLAELLAWTGKGKPAIFQPDFADIKNGIVDDFFKLCWNWKTPLVYCDEILDLAPRGQLPFWFEKVIKQGRQRGITCVFGSQRPKRIPMEVVTESQHYFIGRLAARDDRERMAECTFREVRDIRVPKFQFLYANDSLTKPVIVKADDLVIRRK